MGRNIYEKLEILEETGLLKEDLKLYEMLLSERKLRLEEKNELHKGYEAKSKKADALKKDINKTRKKLKKFREKNVHMIGSKRFNAWIKYNTLFRFTKKGREYRNLKRMLSNQKEELKMDKAMLKRMEAKLELANEKADISSKSLKKLEKAIEKKFRNHREEINFIQTFNRNKTILEQKYSKKEIKAIENIVKAMQENEHIGVYSINELNKKLNKALKNINKENAILPSFSRIEIGNNLESEAQKKEEAEKEEVANKQEEQKESKRDRSNIVQQAIFSKDGIDRNITEKILKNRAHEKLKKLTPDQFMAYIGKIEIEEQHDNNIDQQEIYNQIKELEDENLIMYGKYGAKHLMQIISKMEKSTGVKGKDTWLEQIARVYIQEKNSNTIDLPTAKENKDNSKMMEEDEAQAL